ncbi:MAG: DNA polymerase ligase N-terminal domain-containing protein [Chlamydiota bacterium]|jgi:DNA ligase D-like protein (predicted 3'-phosphoesterase)
MEKSLSTYRKKRDFKKTTEPKGKKGKSSKSLKFVIQKHDASRLHYDFRLQVGNTLKSWAIPKGPSLSTKEKRLAVLTEDHPLEYANFEGVIPEGEYGAGTVMVWDRGKYKNLKEKPILKCFKEGHIEVWLEGEKLQGGFALVHFRDKNWLLIKMKDEKADNRKNPVRSQTKSVKSGKSMKEIQVGKK